MAIRTLVGSAWEDIPDLKVPVNGAYETASCANALVDGAWEEVWGSGYEIGYTLGGYSESQSGISANEDEVRMGFKTTSSETLQSTKKVGIYIYGNFTNPVISCDVTLDCGNVTAMNNTVCGFDFYLDNSRKSTRNVVGYSTAGTTLSGSLSGYTHEGTFDKIFLGISAYIVSQSRVKTFKAVISNLTIDGKKIAGDLVVGSSTYYS